MLETSDKCRAKFFAKIQVKADVTLSTYSSYEEIKDKKEMNIFHKTYEHLKCETYKVYCIIHDLT